MVAPRELGRDFLRKLIEVVVDTDATRPLPRTTWGSWTGWNEAGYHPTGAGDLHFVGFTRFDGGHESREVGLGVMHIDPHTGLS
jgi:hypothetical protein